MFGDGIDNNIKASRDAHCSTLYELLFFDDGGSNASGDAFIQNYTKFNKI